MKLKDSKSFKRLAKCYAYKKFEINGGDSIMLSQKIKRSRFYNPVLESPDLLESVKVTGTNQPSLQSDSKFHPYVFSRGKGKFMMICVEPMIALQGNSSSGPTQNVQLAGPQISSLAFYARKEYKARKLVITQKRLTWVAPRHATPIAATTFLPTGNTTGVPVADVVTDVVPET